MTSPFPPSRLYPGLDLHGGMGRVSVVESVGRIQAWGEERESTGADPCDSLTSPDAPLLDRGALAHLLLVREEAAVARLD